MLNKVYGFTVEEDWLVKYAISRGVYHEGDNMMTGVTGILLLEREAGLRQIKVAHTGEVGDETIVLALYSNRDYDVEKMCFPKISDEKVQKLASLLERPGQKPQWYPYLGHPLD